ncbi:PREDICTED: ubiquitin carboxyl-terminal hydrolase 12-like [Erythranthe guttata]|uniref:ubiquitin carboxyl-terminal hydrolase 12-like n=1 Tax=Erythranthe guttata TaxID=4155 RepID=UPI00064DE589|nr:PREDICTED: ubiquitin carboxyl-terminal hydrolase 12-like [Erythranthe guttata]|eukprot:XP_012833072.1 PREDICTED: ubiquitin carboxyl-terminal hydrolase 12-like [Erythranthe guttata]
MSLKCKIVAEMEASETICLYFLGRESDFGSVLVREKQSEVLRSNGWGAAVEREASWKNKWGSPTSVLNIREGRTRRFLGTKSKWGFSKFISKESLTNPSNGYVVGDKSCVFGAEVFVAKKEAITQSVSSRNVDIPYKRDWIIPNFSKLGKFWVSEVFGAGGEKWTISLYPKGIVVGTHVDICVWYYGCERVEACFTVRIKDQIFDHEYEKSCKYCLFTTSSNVGGLYNFIEIATMNDPKKGFIVNDSCLLQLEISSLRDVAE